MISKDKIKAVYYGILIGDCLGLPVENVSAEQIAEKYGRLQTFVAPTGRNEGLPPCTPSDDWQLTCAVTEAIIEGGLNMDLQVKDHILAYQRFTFGWGRNTKEGIRRLQNGATWANSGKVLLVWATG